VAEKRHDEFNGKFSSLVIFIENGIQFHQIKSDNVKLPA